MDHLKPPQGVTPAPPGDWEGESEVEKQEPGRFEEGYTSSEPGEWELFAQVLRVELRMYAKNAEDVCILRERLEQVVLSGALTDSLQHWGLTNFDVGLIEEPRGYDAHHQCACKCHHECGALPLAPCVPEIEVDGEFVGPSYWRAHVKKVTFFLREPDDATRNEIEDGLAHIVYTTDGSTPTCEQGLVYELDSPITVFNTTTVTAGVCAAGAFSKDVKQAPLKVITAPLHEHYPIFWLSRDGHCARIDAPLSAFYDAPNKMEVTLADGRKKVLKEYDAIEYHKEDHVGPEGVLACSEVPFPPEALYGWAKSTVQSDREEARHEEGTPGQPLKDEEQREESETEYARKRMPDGSWMRVPSYQVQEEIDGSPWRAWSTWSAHPIPGVAVDRIPVEGLRPGRVTKNKYGRFAFGGGEYARRNGQYHEWRIVYRSYDGSTIRIQAPTDTFKTRNHGMLTDARASGIGLGLHWRQSGDVKPTHGKDWTIASPRLAKALQKQTDFTQKEWDSFGIKDLHYHDFIMSGGTYYEPAPFVPLFGVNIEWPSGGWHSYVYETASPVEADEDGPRGIELMAPKGEFPPEVMGGWALQNISPSDAYPVDRDKAEILEKAGVNVGSGFMTAYSGDRRVAAEPVPPTSAEAFDDGYAPECKCLANWTDFTCLGVQHGCPNLACDGDPKPWCIVANPGCAMEEDSDGWAYCDSSTLVVSWNQTSTAGLNNKAVESQRGPSSASEHDQTDVVIAKAAAQTRRANMARRQTQAMARELKTMVAALSKRLKRIQVLEDQSKQEKLPPQSVAAKKHGWFRQVYAGRKNTDVKGSNRKAIQEEEQRGEHEAQITASSKRPQSIPVLDDGAGTTADTQMDTVGNLARVKFPVLSVTSDGMQMRVAAPNDGKFTVGPAAIRVETADGGKAVLPYRQVSAAAEFAAHGRLVTSGLVFDAPVGDSFPLNAAYVSAVADPAHFPIAWRARNGSAIKVLAPNTGTFSSEGGAVLIKHVDGEEDTYAYKSVRFEESSERTGPAGLLLTAAAGTVFPEHGSFAGAGDMNILKRARTAFPVFWRASDGSAIKVQAPNDGSFNLGPSRIFLRLKGYGVTEYPYAEVSVAAAEGGRPAGLLFKAPPHVEYPDTVDAVEPGGFPEPYPVYGRSSDGKTIYVQAPNDGTFEPGPSSVRLRLGNAQVFTFPYSSIAWHPPADGQPGGLAVTAPQGVHFPQGASYAGPVGGFSPSRPPEQQADTVPKEAKPTSQPRDHVRCSPVAAPIKIAAIEAMSAKAYTTAALCIGDRAYLDETELVFRQVPTALQGQTFVRGSESDVEATGADFLVIHLPEPSDLFLLWDERGLPKMGGKLPAWADAAFLDTGDVVWLSGGPMVVLRSRMPVSGPVYLGGAQAFPGVGAVDNYIVVVAAAGALTGVRQDSSDKERATAGTWVQESRLPRALDLRVLLYRDAQHLVVRVDHDPFRKGPGFLRVTGVNVQSGSEGQAQVGQVLEYAEITDIEPGFVGYPGITITAPGSDVFPGGIKSIEPTTYRVVAVRSGGAQLQVDAPQDDWFPAGPATLNLILSDGSQASAVYESVGSLSAKGWGGLIFTALHGEAFPQGARWATPGGGAPASPATTSAALSDFPRKGLQVQAAYPVTWQSATREQMRVECPVTAFERGPAAMLLQIRDNQGLLNDESTLVEYTRSAPVVADGEGPAGVLFTASHGQQFPEHAAMVSPVDWHVAAVRKDGMQMQVLATLKAVSKGPASLRVVRVDGRASVFPYQTAVQLPDEAGVLLTAPRGFSYPHDADFVRKIATATEGDLLSAEAISPTHRQGGSHRLSGTPWLEAHPTGALVVTAAHTTTGRKVAVSVAVPGAQVYTDRLGALLHVPAALYGNPLIALADADAGSRAADLLRVHASMPCYAYVLRDPRGTPAYGGKEPLWLTSNFEPTEDRVQTSIPGMPVFAVYRSKSPLVGPIRLGGNAAFPSRGARENFALVLKAARVQDTFHASSGVDLPAPRDEAASSSDYSLASPPSEPIAEAAAAAAAGAEAGAQAGTRAAAGRVVMDGLALGRIIQQCDSQEAATTCLEHMHACMAPYKMGDMSSCHCFTTSWAKGMGRAEGWCTDGCRLAVYHAYDANVLATTGSRMGCGLG